MNFGIGISKEKDSIKAGEKATADALSLIKKPDLLILFTSTIFDIEKIVSSVFRASNNAPMIGATTAGEIMNNIHFGSCVVIAISCDSDETIEIKGISDIYKDPRAIGQKIVDDEYNEGFLIVFLDGLFTQTSLLVKGINDYLPPSVSLIGSLASDNLKRKSTYQFFNGKVFTRGLCSAFFKTKKKHIVSLRHGFYPISEPLRVTRSYENIIYQIDNHRASKVYLEFLGLSEDELAFGSVCDIKEVKSSPIGIPQITGDYKIKEFLEFKKDGSIVIDSYIPENSIIRILKEDQESLLKAAKECVEEVKELFSKIIFSFPSSFRMLVLGDKIENEINEIKKHVQVPIVGFYGYGEIGPLRTKRSDFHNKSIAMLAIE